MTAVRTPEWLVERLLLRDLPPAEEDQVRERLAKEEDGQARLRALAEDDAAWHAAHGREMNEIDEIRRRARAVPPQRRPGARVLWLAPALAVAAAAIFLTVQVIPWSSWRGATQPEERIKGPGPHLFVYRRGPSTTAELLRPGDRARKGDVLQLTYSSDGHAYGVILSIDGRGSVTRHWPQFGLEAKRLEPGGGVPLAEAYILDDAPGFERFFLVTGTAPFSVEVPLVAAQRLASSPAARITPLPLPAGLEQKAITLEKEP